MSNNVTVYPDTDTWLAARAQSLGASEAPAVMGANPYSSALSIYTKKVEGVVEHETRAMLAGKLLERGIAELWAAEDEPRRLVLPSMLAGVAGGIPVWRIPGTPFSATPDFLAEFDYGDGELPVRAVLEIKNVGGEYDKDGRPLPRDIWKDVPPLWYQMQVQYQLMVLEGCGVDVDHGILCAFFGGADIRTWEIPKDREFWATMQQFLGAWWTRYVEARRPPEPDQFADTEAMRRAWPKSQLGKSVEIPRALAEDLVAKQELAKVAKEAEDRAKVDIQALMQDAEEGTVDGSVVVTWKNQVANFKPQPARVVESRPFKATKAAKLLMP